METPQYALNGEFEITTHPHEMRMSLWVYSPVITERATGSVLLDLTGSPWDLRRIEEGRGRILMTLMCYPDGDREYMIEVAPFEAIAVVEGEAYPLAELGAVLNAIA
ncbi:MULTISPECIES: hypothetical protein [unclassified Halomonas]|uniref:hypothetical protein n=1 Tax=unclassified Halomonas TaxID=2609666 RepID=UPI0020766DD6|nr:MULTISPECIES: hypothetical protein [unclassified Halomonas]